MCAPPLLPNVGGGGLLYLKFIDFCRDKSNLSERKLLCRVLFYRNVWYQNFSIEIKGRVPGTLNSEPDLKVLVRGS